MTTTLYHNPRCSKSRQTLELLEKQGITPDIILYLQNPPTENELANIIAQLGIHPSALIRFKEDKAEELELHESDKRSDKEWISIMVENPVLIERPIVIHNNKACIGRPPEKVLEILYPHPGPLH